MNLHTHRIPSRKLVATLATCAIVTVLAIGAPTPASAAACSSSGPAGYQVTLCFTAPADGGTVTGPSTVTVSVNVTGSNPGVRRMIFYLDGQYLLIDFQAPYTFSLPTQKFADGAKSLEVEALMRDGYTTTRSQIGVTFDNGNAV
ncbi:MAG: Ig-like domain-containing protein, partial [Actinomycetota bacterium]|nr:Ig-like domain-containing protein [Actinomycetota bacterium]